MRTMLIAAVATAALAFAGVAGAQTNNNMSTDNNMNMGGNAPAASNGLQTQQPQAKKAQPRRHVAHQRTKHHKMARKASSHKMARKASTKRLAHKGSTHKIAKRSSKSTVGLASGKLQQPKQQQAKKRAPVRETTGTGSAGSMQNTSPQKPNNNYMQR